MLTGGRSISGESNTLKPCVREPTSLSNGSESNNVSVENKIGNDKKNGTTLKPSILFIDFYTLHSSP